MIYFKTEIESEAIHIWPGNTRNYLITSDGSFSVTSLDPTVAEAKVENKTLFVTATGIGETSIILSSEDYNELKIRVLTVLEGLYTEEHELDGYSPKVNVTANSEEVANSIIEEITTEMAKLNHAHYYFEYDGRFKLGLRVLLMIHMRGLSIGMEAN